MRALVRDQRLEVAAQDRVCGGSKSPFFADLGRGERQWRTRARQIRWAGVYWTPFFVQRGLTRTDAWAKTDGVTVAYPCSTIVLPRG